MTLEQIRNEIANNEFDLDYAQLGLNEKEWVNDEIHPNNFKTRSWFE